MSASTSDFTRISFIRTFVVPALLVFLIPGLAFAFFRYVQGRYDAMALESILKEINNDPNLSPEDRSKAIVFFKEHPFSELVRQPDNPMKAEGQTAWDFATFHWMLQISWWCILSGLALIVLVGLCVFTSTYSQQALHWSMSLGWNVLRVFGAFQTAAQGTLLVAMSFWVPAFFTERFSVKLIFVVGLLALGGVGAVIMAIFRRTDASCHVAGNVVDSNSSPRLWQALRKICEQVGTPPPDQVIVGIDDNFFVTEMPVQLNGQSTLRGRTLFVSLSLLKQMTQAEADAVMAHEMAHFSGNDTLFSKKISPLLIRFGNYLQALYDNPIARPLFYFMSCFRALFELTLQKHSRDREFRADKIACDITSPQALAGGLLRIIAYSNYRNQVQNELFGQEKAMEAANVSGRVEEGFKDFALAFAAKTELGDLKTTHPFDTHPSIEQRLSAVNLSLEDENVRLLCATPGEGAWYHLIDDAERLEGDQWREFEENFRKVHEQSLAYRFLPETEVEKEVVVKAFPAVTYECKKGQLSMDHEQVMFSKWKRPLLFSQITGLTLHENSQILVQYKIDKVGQETIPYSAFGADKQRLLDDVGRYYYRYTAAKAYQASKQQAAANENGAAVGAS